MSDPSANGSEPDPADTDTPFERFERLTRQLVKVPKTEIDKARKKRSKRVTRRRAASK